MATAFLGCVSLASKAKMGAFMPLEQRLEKSGISSACTRSVFLAATRHLNWSVTRSAAQRGAMPARPALRVRVGTTQEKARGQYTRHLQVESEPSSALVKNAHVVSRLGVALSRSSVKLCHCPAHCLVLRCRGRVPGHLSSLHNPKGKKRLNTSALSSAGLSGRLCPHMGIACLIPCDRGTSVHSG